MHYEDSPALSAGHLRLVIPLISKHGLAANPITYTVLYEYISGINQPLNQQIDTVLEKDQPLTDGLMDVLYKQFVSEWDEANIKRIFSSIHGLLKNLLASSVEAGGQATDFNQSLDTYGSQLTPGLEASSLQNIIVNLASDAQAMQNAVSTLTTTLDNTQNQVNQLQSELKRAQAEAIIDGLTGLVNRKGFSEIIENARLDVPSTQSPLCLLMVDIDHFKRVNDTFGHLVGDKVIQIVANALKQHIKGKDTAARFGGEEFAILLPETNLDGAVSVAENIRQVIEKTELRRKSDNASLGSVTISIGVTCYHAGESINKFIDRADVALYESKNGGRNQVTMKKSVETELA